MFVFEMEIYEYESKNTSLEHLFKVMSKKKPTQIITDLFCSIQAYM